MSSVEEVVVVDSKGRVTIPIAIRELFNIRKGMYLLIVANRNSREIKLIPLPTTARLFKIKMMLEDRIGVLAEVTDYLASRSIDIISTRCVVLKREVLGECEIVVDISKSDIVDTSSLESGLKTLGPVKEVEITKMM